MDILSVSQLKRCECSRNSEKLRACKTIFCRYFFGPVCCLERHGFGGDSCDQHKASCGCQTSGGQHAASDFCGARALAQLPQLMCQLPCVCGDANNKHKQIVQFRAPEDQIKKFHSCNFFQFSTHKVSENSASLLFIDLLPRSSVGVQNAPKNHPVRAPIRSAVSISPANGLIVAGVARNAAPV